MYLAHDPDRNFWYYGEEPPRAGMFRDYLTDPKLVAVDVETISLKERIAIGVGIAPSPSMAFYFPLFPKPSVTTPWHLLQDPAVTRIFQNAPFDLLCLWEYDVSNENIRDTNVMGHLLNIKPSKLVDLMTHVAVFKDGKMMEVHTAAEVLAEYGVKKMLDLTEEVVARKCCQDCLATFEVYNGLLPHMDMDYFNTEMEATTILVDMSLRGLKLDQDARAELEEELQVEVDQLFEMCDEEGFSPASPQQVGYMLAKRGAYRVFTKLPFTRRHRQLDTSEEILRKMNDPMAALVLNHRAKSKLLNTYIKPWAGDDRAYTRFHSDAITGRASSTDRNMQNIPKGRPRGIFIPDDGLFTDLDFSQMELRILAHLSQDPEMCYIYSLPREHPDADIHQATADYLGVDRRICKNVNFAMVYGATDETMAEVAKIPSVTRAKQLKEMWFEKYRGARDWIYDIQEQGLRHHYVTTLYGRKIALPTEDEDSIGGIRRKAVDYPNQGTAAEILKRALIKCKHLDMVLQIHDEILFNGAVRPPDLEHIHPDLWTPTDIKYLERWE